MNRDEMIAELHRRRAIEDAWINGAEIACKHLQQWGDIWSLADGHLFKWGQFDYRVATSVPLECWVNVYRVSDLETITMAYSSEQSARDHATGGSFRIGVHMVEAAK